MFNASMKFPKPRIPSPVPTARRRASSEEHASGVSDSPEQAPRHRYMIRTQDFVTGSGEPMTNYAILMYGTSADDAAAKALNVVQARFAPSTLPAVTGVTCDMGCIQRHHT